MNDFEIDELASAYLDDAATDEERARVDSDPALRARVDELRRVRDAVHASGVEPAPAAARDAAIASALAASPLVDLGAERVRRRVRIASIAAAAVLLVGAVGLVLRSASSDSSTKASTAAAASSSSESSAAAASPAFSVVPNSVVSAYPDRDALVAGIRATLRSAQPTTAAGAASSANDESAPKADSTSTTRCAAAQPDHVASLLYRELATLAGTPVQIEVFVLDDGSRRVVVTASGTCTLLFTLPL